MKVSNLMWSLIMVVLSVQSVAQPCLSGYSYRRTLTVDNSSNPSSLNSHQVLVNVNTQSLINNGKLNPSGFDIRFTDANGSLLDYFIEPSTLNSTSTKIWVEVNSISATSSETIYMFYGNSSATQGSSGENTFELFDDFAGNSLDNSKWSACGNGNITISNDEVQLSSDGTTTGNAVLTSTNGFNYPVQIQTNVNGAGVGKSVIGILNNSGNGYGLTYETVSGSPVYSMKSLSQSSPQCYSLTNLSAPNNTTTNGAVTQGDWWFYWLDTGAQGYKVPTVGSDQSRNSTLNTLTNPVNVVLGNFDQNSSFSVDYVHVRKYSAHQPSVSVGTEDALVANLSASSNGPVCEGSDLDLTTTFFPGATYSWAGPNGFSSVSQNPTIPSASPAASGTYSVTVNNGSGCGAQVASVTATINPNSVGGTLNGNTTVCSGNNNGTLSLSGETGNVVRWESSSSSGGPWATINNTTTSLNYSNLAATTYYRAVVQSGACNETVSSIAAVQVEGPSDAGTITGGATVCEAQNSGTLTLTGNTGNVLKWQVSTDNFNWTDIANTSSTLNYSNLTETTYYRVDVAASPCGSDYSDPAIITVNPKPDVDFTDNNACEGTATVFSNNTTLFSGSQSSFNWTFGDGNGSTSENPSHTYASAGSYNVTLQVTSSDGCTGSFTKTISVKETPNMSWNAQDICEQTIQTFSNSTTISLGASITSYNWDFDDGTFSTSTSPNKSFNSTGVYDVKLEATTNQGCTDSLVKQVEVFPRAQVSFSAQSACVGENVSFSNNTSVATGSATYVWDFDDGNFSSAINPLHTFNAPGAYDVKLVATTNNGCADSTIVSVVIEPQPTADFSFSDVCDNNAVSFTDLSVNGGSGTLNYNWDFGDGNSSTQQSPQHTYAQSGTYTVTLQVTGNGGCSDVITKSVNVRPNPVSDFSSSQSCATNAMTFTNSSGISSGSLTYQWDFDDGTFSTATNPTKNYAIAGTYDVRLIAQSGFNCTDTTIKTVTVSPNTVAGSINGAASVCSGANNGTLNITGNTGSVVRWESSTTGGSPWTTINNNSTSLNYQNLNQTTHYRALVKSGGCDSVYTQAVEIEVSPQSVGGQAVGNQTVCSGNNSGVLTVTGKTGDITDWIYEPVPGSGFTSVGISTDSLQFSNLTQSRNYFAVVKSGACESDTSQIAVITVNPQTVSGTLTGTDTVCESSNNGALTVTGKTGDIIRWESSSTGGSPWTTINHTTSTLNYNNLNSTTTYRALVQSAGCQSVYTNAVTIHVNPSTVAGSVNGNNTICSGVNSGFVTLNNAQGIVQKWQLSTDGLNWSDINNNDQIQNYSNLDTTTWYRAQVKSGVCSAKFSDSAKITVNPKPDVDFSNTTACLQTATQFSDQTTISPGSLANATYTWDFDDGAGSSAQNPNYTFSSAGTFDVVLNVTTAAGCVDSITKSITVNPIPNVNFNVQDVCFPEQANFTNLSFVPGGSVSSYNWDFDDGNSSNQAVPSHQYSAAGTYQVKLVAESNTGCSDSITKSLNINPKPQASFSADSICLGSDLNLVNASSISNGNLDYLWRFGNGNTDTLQTPSYTYSASGNFTLILEANSQLGCSDTASQVVEVYQQPTASFSTSDICLNDTAQFADQSSNVTASANYNWQFGDGNSSTLQNPVHVYNGDGSFSVSMSVTTVEGCTDSSSQFIQVHPNPVADFTVDDICLGDSAQFNNQSTITAGSASYNWQFGDGLQLNQYQPTYQYANQGNYDVTLTATTGFGCVDSTTKPIKVFDATDAGSIIGADSVCDTGNNGVVILSGNTGSPLFWESSQTGVAPWNSVNSNNDSLQYGSLSTTTWYRAVVQNGVCPPDTSSKAKITVSPASFGGILTGNDTVCASANAGNMNLSNTIGSIIDWLISTDSAQSWNNYNGTGSVNSYNNLGQSSTFAVRVKSGVCEADTSNPITIQVDSATLAGTLFGADTVCASQNSGFVEVSGARGSVQSWEQRYNPADPWVTVINGSDSLHYQNLTDSTYYRAKVKNGVCSTIKTNTVQVRVDESTQAGTVFGSSTHCESVNSGSVNLMNNNGTVNRWQYSVDGNPWQDTAFTGQILNYQNLDTTLLYRAVVQNGVCNERFSDSAIVTINPLPDLAFHADTVCYADTTFFIDQSTIPTGFIQQRNWDFDNGSGASIQNPQHVYGSGGVYNVQLKATSNNGCVDSLTQPVVVNELPQVNFTQSDVCQLDSMGFNNFTTIPSGSITQYVWNFGDGDTAQTNNPFHTYSSHGNYNVQLYAQANTGCADSVSQQVTVHPHPVANWTADTVFEPNTTTFQNNTSIVNGAQLTYDWQFGDGTNSQAVNPVHQYSQYGNYNALLVAQSNFGCADTLAQMVEVLEKPIAQFAAQDQCIHDSIEFNNQSQYTSGTADYIWDFGDGDTSHQVSPKHIYAFPGNYTVELNIVGDNGGSDQYTTNISVYAKPSVAFSFEDVCDSIPVKFRNQSTISNGNMTYEWFFDDGDTAQAKSPEHVYPTSGFYDAKLLATSNFGCVDSAIQQVQILSRPESNFNVPEICYGDTSEFENTTTISNGFIVSYNWNFGDATNTNSIVESPVYLFLNAGRYPVTLQTESNEGCISVYTDTAVVLEKPVADYEFEDVCLGESMPFTNNSFFSSGIPFYDWQFDDGGTSAQREPKYRYSEPGEYDVLLTVTSPDQCFDTMKQTVEVYDLPQPRVEAQETTVSKGFSTQLAATGGVSYLWSPGESLNEADIQTPVATPLQTTTFTVTALDSNGCVNDTAITIDVEEDYKAIANNVITPDGNGQNDRWIVQNIENYDDCTVSIYNRWGQKVYSEKGYNNNWQGTNQAGEPLPDATYYYVIWFEGSDREYKGAVTVLRNER
ncbi:DUF2341 domain-containing protein [Salibacter halophilus]|uniref:DUF2341 domain-containing protein n=1 Tax=Salibacter halophilus TaxID=1803916 RepID=A0A6N6M965_9FLAO|nr:DUF2341 domain-containing protein [Salibacter halophilus]KAB1065515.1 DUF2341 domain-containing protein [Salibacter halophilus]